MRKGWTQAMDTDTKITDFLVLSMPWITCLGWWISAQKYIWEERDKHQCEAPQLPFSRSTLIIEKTTVRSLGLVNFSVWFFFYFQPFYNKFLDEFLKRWKLIWNVKMSLSIAKTSRKCLICYYTLSSDRSHLGLVTIVRPWLLLWWQRFTLWNQQAYQKATTTTNKKHFKCLILPYRIFFQLRKKNLYETPWKSFFYCGSSGDQHTGDLRSE